MEIYTSDQIGAIEAIIERYLKTHQDIFVRRILGVSGLDLVTVVDKNITLNTYGAGKAYYNGVEINTGGGGGGTGTGNKIVGSGCTGSAIQPTVECSPSGAACEIRATVGKGGKFRILESA